MTDYQDELSHGYIAVVPASRHGKKLTKELLFEVTEDFKKPAVFKDMVAIDSVLANRVFYQDIDPAAKTVWRRQKPGVGVKMEDRYDYVSGEEGAASQFLNEVFSGVSTYAFLGPMAYQFGEPGAQSWGSKVFRKVQREVFKDQWLAFDSWKLTGQLFFGASDTLFGEPADGFPGSDWHSAASINLFVMVAGLRKWLTYPPHLEEQLGNTATRIEGSLRVKPKDSLKFDTVYLRPGDVLVNPPFEWHKVLNGQGFSCGMACRIKDIDYGRHLLKDHLGGVALEVGADEKTVAQVEAYLLELFETESVDGEDGPLHLLTSSMYASKDPRRAPLLLGVLEGNMLRAVFEMMLNESSSADSTST